MESRAGNHWIRPPGPAFAEFEMTITNVTKAPGSKWISLAEESVDHSGNGTGVYHWGLTR